ncbi:MAG: biopolymer transporter ExbD [Lentisphaerae bacterium]|jgi:biopolymer transport protein ExbD|nr:biopolymer transporter ExbD [Lentisphaerota bacterium]
MSFESLRRKRKETAVPTDSLSDIAFLLIIFFILATSIQKIAGFRTDLPSGSRDQQTQKADDKTPTVGLKGDRIQFNEEDVSIDELRTKLAALRLKERSEERRVVLLDASAETGYQTYYSVMAAITAADGVIGIMTEDD